MYIFRRGGMDKTSPSVDIGIQIIPALTPQFHSCVSWIQIQEIMESDIKKHPAGAYHVQVNKMGLL